MRTALLLIGGAALLALGQGHHPVGPAAVLGLALVARAFRTGHLGLALPAFAGLHVGVAELAYRGMIPLDAGPRLGMHVGVALALGLILAADARVARRAPGFASTLVLPCGWVAFDLLSARLSPGGTWGSLAYSFVEPLALAQVASLVGWTGLTFLAAWTASSLAWAAGVERRRAARGLAAVALVLAAAVVFGRLRLRESGEPARLPTASVVAPSTYGRDDATVEEVWAHTRGVELPPERSERARARIAASLDEHLALAERALDAGARLVVFAEANASLTTAERPTWLARAGELARARGGWIGLGLVTFDPGEVLASRNELVVVGPDGEVAFEFLKATRPPGASHAIGEGILPPVALGEARVSAAICFDLDFPQLFPPVGRAGPDFLIAPSNDWEEASAAHARMARLRAIEQGFGLLRPTKDGLSLVCDRAGRVLASLDTLEPGTHLLLADVPLDGRATLYARVGDAFAWLGSAGFLLAVAGLFRRSRAPETAGAAAS